MKAYLKKDPGIAEVLVINYEKKEIEVLQGVYGATKHNLDDVILFDENGDIE